MKRVSLILIVAIYLISVMGVSGSNFYCCGKYKESYLITHLNPSKDCNKDNESKDCCVTKVFFSKVKDNHSPTNEIKVNDATSITLFNAHFSELINHSLIADAAQSTVPLHPPPLLNKLPVYLTNEVFLI